jgi:hypothetical protein
MIKRLLFFSKKGYKQKKLQISLKLYLVAGTGLEPVTVAMDENPLTYKTFYSIIVLQSIT